MKEIIFNRKAYNSYKDFYCDVYDKLDGANMVDWKDWRGLDYHADHLNEFLWYCKTRNIKYIFVNFDKEKIALQKNYDDYEYNIIIKVFERFVKNYPNNKLEFRLDEKETKMLS